MILCYIILHDSGKRKCIAFAATAKAPRVKAADQRATTALGADDNPGALWEKMLGEFGNCGFFMIFLESTTIYHRNLRTPRNMMISFNPFR